MALVAESFGDLNRLKQARDAAITGRILQTVGLNRDAAATTRQARSGDMSLLLQAAQAAQRNRALRQSTQAEAEERRLARAMQMLQRSDVNRRFTQSQDLQRELTEGGRRTTAEREGFGDAIGFVQSGMQPEEALRSLRLPPTRLPALQAQREVGKISEQIRQREIENTTRMANEAMAPVQDAVSLLGQEYDLLKESGQDKFDAEEIAASAMSIARQYGVGVPFETSKYGSTPESLLKYADAIQQTFVEQLTKQKPVSESAIWDARTQQFKPRRIVSRFADTVEETGGGQMNSRRDQLLNRIMQLQSQ